MNLDEICGSLLAIALSILILAIGAGGIYIIIGTYNERAECQKLGIPLYRCEAKSYKADVNVDVRKDE